jgi:hypothetical protein
MLACGSPLLYSVGGKGAAVDEISMDIEAQVSDEVNLRRFRWRLKAPGQSDQPSPESFATKREAIQAGTIALRRAIQKGRIGR